VFFLRPVESDLQTTTNILRLFGEASGLRTNMAKSNISPIQCADSDMQAVTEHLPCRIEDFPIKYLGLPLSIKKLTKPQLQPLIDRLADLLPGWKVDLMTRVGRAIQVQFVLTTTIIYHAMTLDMPNWMHKAIDKIRRNYLWRRRKEANGGHCLVAWSTVTRPKDMGSLGIADLRNLGRALRVRWKWLQRTDPEKPWAFLPLQMS
jgi:hypothetical protein